METSFKLKTGQNCFLCYSSLPFSNSDKNSFDYDGNPHSSIIKSEENGDAENSQIDQPSVKYSLLTICRYLNLNQKQIFKEFGNAEKENLLLEQFPKVPLCEKCGELVEQLTELCRELEVIQMKVDDKLRIFQTYLETRNDKTGNDCQLESSLRTRLKIICENKLKCLLPRVELKVCNYTQQTKDNEDSTLAAEPIVVKIEYGEIDIQNNFDETPTPEISAEALFISSSQINKIQHNLVEIPTQISPKSNLRDSLPHQKQCDQCGKWINKDCLARHKRKNCKFKITPNVELEGDKLHECRICHKRFGNPIGLRKHFRVVHPSVPATATTSKFEVKCEHCGRMINKHNMGRHLEQTCPKNKAMEVEHPATDPLGETELERHLLNQKNRSSKPTSKECNQCGKMIAKSRMACHKRVWCKFGPRETPTVPKSNNILSAKGFSVLNNGKAKCNQCEAIISRFGTWRHTNMHCPFGPRLPNPEKKPTACVICGKMFQSAFSMYRHKKKAHSGHVNALKINSVSSLVVKSETTTERNGLL